MRQIAPSVPLTQPSLVPSFRLRRNSRTPPSLPPPPELVANKCTLSCFVTFVVICGRFVRGFVSWQEVSVACFPPEHSSKKNHSTV